MQRYITTLGAPTTAGGKVITANSTISINDVKVALEGDKVFCPACKSAETRTCSKAFGWVPKPPGGRASVTWLALQLGRGIFNLYRNRLSVTCARAVIYKWKSALDMASAGVATGSLPKWA